MVVLLYLELVTRVLYLLSVDRHQVDDLSHRRRLSRRTAHAQSLKQPIRGCLTLLWRENDQCTKSYKVIGSRNQE